MNLLSRVLPDFSARLCGRSIGALLFRRQGRDLLLRLPPRAPAQAAAWAVGNTTWLIVYCSSEFSGRRGPAARSPAPTIAVRYRTFRGCRCFARNRLVHSGVSRSASLATVGGEISTWISFELSGTAADERSPCEVRRGPHWKKSGRCQANHNSSGGSKEEP